MKNGFQSKPHQSSQQSSAHQIEAAADRTLDNKQKRKQNGEQQMKNNDKKIAIIAAIAFIIGLAIIGWINNQAEQPSHKLDCEARITSEAVICR